MAKEARKRQRAQQEPKPKQKLSSPREVTRPEMPDPLGKGQLKALGWRLGIPLAALWAVGIVVAGFSTSTLAISLSLGLPGLATLAAAGLVYWALGQAKKARRVASLLGGIHTDEDRAAALVTLGEQTSGKKKDVAAVFAKAQLELQDDPRKALATLEGIDLGKVMATIADEARGQRAMIHLMIGEATAARDLADGIDLKRHQEGQSRAMLGAVAAEAWARTGAAKKALEMVELFDPEDEAFAAIRPQLYRARAFAYAYTNQREPMRQALRKLMATDIRLLGGFMVKRTHPLLQQEAKKLVERSGQVPRKMVIQRR